MTGTSHIQRFCLIAGTWRWWFVAICFAMLAACASSPSRDATYTVKRGDTLYAIAQRYRVDYRELARWNGIGRDNLIVPGQVLRLHAPGARVASRATAPSAGSAGEPRVAAVPPVLAPPVPWLWPVTGGAATLTARPNGGHGLTIRGTHGQDIFCASSGRVVYLGAGLLGYGQLLIIKHNDSYLSAYGHTESVTVHEGDYVAAGQRVATMGDDPQGRPTLYFEIRINGAPRNPLLFLPARPAE